LSNQHCRQYFFRVSKDHPGILHVRDDVPIGEDVTLGVDHESRSHALLREGLPSSAPVDYDDDARQRLLVDPGDHVLGSRLHARRGHRDARGEQERDGERRAEGAGEDGAERPPS
jgi:hypothetical protein